MRDTPFQRWPTIDRLFEQALALDEQDRSRFVDHACADPELRRELHALLEAEKRSEALFDPAGVLDAIPDLAGGTRGPVTDTETLPFSVGSYRLLEVLGRGGAATVFRAERADGEFKKNVAFKLLRPTVLTSAALGRFRQERQILASLRHPNVAHLLDGGVTEDGRPFIVMELVEGDPIDRYCDRHALGIPERLRLFQTVCEAVHCAHEQLIVHRDIKPSNVLVSRNGNVKLLDFGIAKLLDPEGFQGSPVETRTGVFPMTPSYASPEQILGLGVTTATDIYQLGELAYELLTGRRLQGQDVTSLEQLRARLDEDRIEPLSRVVASEGASPTPEEIARRRGTDPRRLHRQLRGDVDRIVRVALRPEPDRRYASAQQLATDVGRYLDRLPISVSPDSMAYRVERFARRHPWGVPGTLVAAATIGILGAQLVGQYRRTVVEKERADAVITFLTGLFDVADPRGGVGDTVTVRAVLGEGAKRVSRELEDQPLVAATMRDAIGRAYMGLGRFDEARVLMDEALRVREQVLGPDDPSVASSVLGLADLASEMRDLEVALRLSERALDEHVRLYGSASPETAKAMAQLAFILQGLGRREEARSLYEGALTVMLPMADQSRTYAAEVGEMLTNLAWILLGAGELDAAANRLESALAMRKSGLGERHPAVANTLRAFVQLYLAQSQPDSAAIVADEIIRIRSEHFGPDHPSLGDAWMGRAEAAQGSGDFGTAEASYRAAIEIFRVSYGSPSPDLALALNNLGGLLRNEGRFSEAEVVARDALEAYRAALGPDHPFTGIAAHNLAATLEAQGRWLDAARGYRDAIEIMSVQWPDDHARIALSRAALGSALVESAAFGECQDPLRRANAVLDSVLEAGDSRRGLVWNSLGACLLGGGPSEEGDSLLMLGYEAVMNGLDPNRPEVRLVQARMARLREDGPH